jgi:hypothetical protein
MQVLVLRALIYFLNCQPPYFLFNLSNLWNKNA